MKNRDLQIELAKYDGDLDVAMSSDAEGNTITQFADADESWAFPMYQVDYELVHPDDFDDEWEEEDMPERILVLWPV